MKKIISAIRGKISLGFEIIKADGVITFLKAFLFFINRILGFTKNQILNKNNPISILQQKQKSLRPAKKQVLKEIINLKANPLVLIIIEVNNSNVDLLDITIYSLKGQFYKRFDVLLFGELSSSNTLKLENKSLNKLDFKLLNYIKTDFSNITKQLTEYDFFTIMTSGDTIEPISLYSVANIINNNNDIELIYSDEAFKDENDQVFEPLLKPDYSPQYAQSLNYIHRMAIYSPKQYTRRSTNNFAPKNTKQLELFLNLGCYYSKDNTAHITDILYYNHIQNHSDFNSILEAYNEDHRLILEHLFKSENTIIKSGLNKNDFHLIKKQSIPSPLVSIIIPFKDKVDILRQCLESIFSLTSYKNYEILLISNNSQKEETYDYLNVLEQNNIIKILEDNDPFNYSRINNNAVKKAKGEYIIFLNNDIEVISPNWIEEMLGQILLKNVGIVGAKLLYPNRSIQHAGVITGFGGGADHIMLGEPDDSSGYMYRASSINNYSAVTAACMMVSKTLFEETGGFDEKDLKIAFNDVDFCLKARKKGLYIAYTPYAKLIHYESLSRGKIYDEDEMERHLYEVNIIKKRWKTDQTDDPFYNPYLSLSKKDFSLRI